MLKDWLTKIMLEARAAYLCWKAKRALKAWREADEALRAELDELRTFNEAAKKRQEARYFYS